MLDEIMELTIKKTRTLCPDSMSESRSSSVYLELPINHYYLVKR